MKKLIIFICLFSIAACNSKSDDDIALTREEQIEKKLNLPPEPDAEINNSTRLGVDSNNNKIRDDVERIIGFAFPDDESTRNFYNRRAIVWSEILENDGNIDKQKELIDEYFINLNCDYTDYTLKTPETKDIDSLLQIAADNIMYFNKLVSKIYNVSLPNPTNDEIKIYCESF